MEGKVINYKFEGGFFIITVDPNKDGNALVEFKISAAELLAEIASALAKKPEAPQV